MRFYVMVFAALLGCHDGAASTVTIATPQTSATYSSSVALSTPESPEATTRKRATALTAAVQSWRATHPEDCPLAQALVLERAIADELTVDAWKRPFKIVCDDDATIVSSFGPDGKEGTADDIR